MSIRFTYSEAWINGKKYLHKDGILYMIRNREKDDDYIPNEIWKFSSWCGRKAPVTVQRIFTKEYSAAPTCVKCGHKSQKHVCDYCVVATCLNRVNQKPCADSPFPPMPVYPLLPATPAYPLLPETPRVSYPPLPPSPVDEEW